MAASWKRSITAVSIWASMLPAPSTSSSSIQEPARAVPAGRPMGVRRGGTVSSGWHLVTATFNGTTATLYVDNAVVATDTFTAPGNTAYPLYFAATTPAMGMSGMAPWMKFVCKTGPSPARKSRTFIISNVID